MPAVVVSVHDVAPPHLEGLRALLRALDGIGARPRVLKVVPHFAHRWSLGEDPALVQLLREEVAIGGELVLHGYTHRTEGPLRGSLRSRLRAEWFAARDAEFLSISEEEAQRRLRAGLEQLREAGFAPVGFCAPGWLFSPWLARLLRRLGFRYHVTMGGLHDLVTGRRLWVPWFGAVGAGGAHEFLVHLGGALGAGLARTRYPVVKAFFHPQGAHTWGPQLARLRRALRGRKPTTYRVLIDA